MAKEILDSRARIIRAATELLASGGRDAVSTRAVSAAASVQAPTIYRQFGDMRGLLDAVAREVLADYVRQKSSFELTEDPVADLRAGFQHHVAFGLTNPAAYRLIYSAPETFADAPAKREGEAILVKQVTRIAEAGRLKVSVPHAVRLITSAAKGVVLSLIAMPVSDRDPGLANSMCDAILAAIATNASADQRTELDSESRVAARAVALRAVLAESQDVLSSAEQRLMGEWLDRLATKRA